MTFLISFPKVLRRIIGQNIFREMQAILLGLVMMIKENVLKYDS